MPQFDDLNEALAALKVEMRKATTATQAVTRLGEAADAVGQHVSSVETRLHACEISIAAVDDSILGVNQSIEKLGKQSVQQWKEATTDVLADSGSNYLDAFAIQVKKSGAEFSESVASLNVEWAKREGETADAMIQHASNVEARLQECEDRIGAVDKSISEVNQSIEKLGKKSAQQWKTATTDVITESGSQYVDAVAKQVKESGAGFTERIASMNVEWAHRLGETADVMIQHASSFEARFRACELSITSLSVEQAQRESDLKFMKKWMWILNSALAVTLVGIAVVIGFDLYRP
jgi:chromosome segregation ATPase